MTVVGLVIWELSFAGDFLFGGVIWVWAVGFVCLLVGDFTLVVSLAFSLFAVTDLGLVWSSAECRFFSCSWNFGQSFSSSRINFSTGPLYLLSWLQQRRSCFRPYRHWLFSLLPKRTHSFCVSPQVFLFLFYRIRKILHKLGDFFRQFEHLVSCKQSSSIWSGSF